MKLTCLCECVARGGLAAGVGEAIARPRVRPSASVRVRTKALLKREGGQLDRQADS